MSGHQHQEQRHGKPHPDRQSMDGTLGFALVCHEIEQRGPEASHDRDDEKDDDDFHIGKPAFETQRV